MDQRIKIFFHVIIWGSLALMAFAAYMIVDNAYFWMRAESATAVIIDYKTTEESLSKEARDRHEIPGTIYTPYLMFKTATNQEVRFLSQVEFHETSEFKIGDEMPILYFPSDPQSAKNDNLFQLFGGPILMFLFFGFFWGIYLFGPKGRIKTFGRNKKSNSADG